MPSPCHQIKVQNTTLQNTASQLKHPKKDEKEPFVPNSIY